MAVYFFLGRYEEDVVGERIRRMGFIKSKKIDGEYNLNNGEYCINLTDSGRGTIEIQGEGMDPRLGKLSPKARAFLEKLASALKPVRITDVASRDVLPELVRTNTSSKVYK